MMDAPAGSDRILGSLGQPERLRAVAALVLGARTAADVARVTGFDRRRVTREIGRLVAAGLVEDAGHGVYRLREDELLAAARAAAAPAPDEVRGPPATPQEKVRRAFLRDGRLVSIPAVRSKRLVVLDFLAQEFEPGARYPEREVNRRLRAYHPDVASLRRYLVDEGFLSRDARGYWRTGGTVPVG